jgi:hypothetical protein
MAGFNGAGAFIRSHDWTADADAAINIRADRMDEEDDGFATGLTNCITKDGQTSITANIPMNSKKLTGLAAPTAAGDALSYGSGTNTSTLLVQTRQKLTSGTGATYTTPANCRQLRVRIFGAGGGGASKSSTASNGSAGGTSTFHGLTAISGGGGAFNGNAGAGGTGGSDTPTSGSVTGLVRVDGNGGGPGVNATASTGANGGFGGAGGLGGGTTNSNSAKANSGAGGSGQGVASSAEFSGGGGGGGEIVEFFINSPAATYLYTIGAAGAAGTGGGNGGSGLIIVDEFY